jgi:alkylation response protein AidB-like acyl-CoA dehydrogenase
MTLELTAAQTTFQQECRGFVEREIVPRAEAYDAAGEFPIDLVRAMAARGFLGAAATVERGGIGLDPVSFGLLCEEVGRGCASARSLITVHNMSLAAIGRWGGEAAHRSMSRFAAGDAILAFALSEPHAGSDASAISTTANRHGDHFVLNGTKKWITFAQIADAFLLFAKLDGEFTAFLVERTSPGLDVAPITDLAGCRASMLAELRLTDCRIPASAIVGRPGSGWQYVAATGLDHGRYSVAWGCVGMAQACLEASLGYASTRRQFGEAIGAHQLVRRHLADMIAEVDAARLLCMKAAWLRQAGDPAMVAATSVAKYFGSRTASRVAGTAVQLHGANGFTRAFPVQRHWRDAKVMEVIEGSNEIQQLMIAGAALREARP